MTTTQDEINSMMESEGERKLRQLFTEPTLSERIERETDAPEMEEERREGRRLSLERLGAMQRGAVR